MGGYNGKDPNFQQRSFLKVKKGLKVSCVALGFSPSRLYAGCMQVVCKSCMPAKLGPEHNRCSKT